MPAPKVLASMVLQKTILQCVMNDAKMKEEQVQASMNNINRFVNKQGGHRTCPCGRVISMNKAGCAACLGLK